MASLMASLMAYSMQEMLRKAALRLMKLMA